MTDQPTRPVVLERKCSICLQPFYGEPPPLSGDARCPRCDQLFDCVCNQVSQLFEVAREQIHPETSFVDDLGADSLEIVELLMAFEDAFDISIPDADHERIRTVGDAIRYIEQSRRGPSPNEDVGRA